MITITEKTQIKYTIENEYKEQYELIFYLEQIEGSMPNFYKQLEEKFNGENCKIVKREIIE